MLCKNISNPYVLCPFCRLTKSHLSKLTCGCSPHQLLKCPLLRQPFLMLPLTSSTKWVKLYRHSNSKNWSTTVKHGHLIRENEPLFPDEIQAWTNGPIISTLFEKHKGIREISFEFFKDVNYNSLNHEQKETINKVLNLYGNKNTRWLVNLTHSEEPWKDARVGLKEGEVGTKEITKESIKNYYSSI